MCSCCYFWTHTYGFGFWHCSLSHCPLIPLKTSLSLRFFHLLLCLDIYNINTANQIRTLHYTDPFSFPLSKKRIFTMFSFLLHSTCDFLLFEKIFVLGKKSSLSRNKSNAKLCEHSTCTKKSIMRKWIRKKRFEMISMEHSKVEVSMETIQLLLSPSINGVKPQNFLQCSIQTYLER